MKTLQMICRRSQLFQPLNILGKDAVDKEGTMSKTYKLMLQTGIIRRVNTGMYALLPLGMRVLNKIIALVHTEMEKIGAQNILLPALINSNLWKKTDRYADAKSELFTLRDRHNKEYILGPTHEETITNMISELGTMSPAKMPLKLYQISSKWRDEMKPRIGFLRTKEFVMKDLYTFDSNLESARKTYDLVCDAYRTLFEKIGVECVTVLGETGDVGGILSHEYHYLSDIGEDIIQSCPTCHYNIKKSLGESNCPHCKNILTEHKGIEVGHTFLLDTKYSEVFNATCNMGNKYEPLAMGCYGLGLSRIITAATEILSTNNGLRWPKCLAPYTVCLIPPKKGSKEESASQLVGPICDLLSPLNTDMILDDRTEMTIGKRFVEAQQVGYPYIIVIGKRAMESSPLIEVHSINDSTSHNISIEELNDYFFSKNDNESLMKHSGIA